MKFKKVLCGVTAALTVLSFTVIAAQAEDAAELRLLTAAPSEIHGASAIYTLGDNYYAYDNILDSEGYNDVDGFVYIGKDELTKWRETGKIAYKDIETDLDLTNALTRGGFSEDGNYMNIGNCDANRRFIEVYAVYHDAANTKITTAYKADDYTRPDGYTLSCTRDDNTMTLTFTVTSPDGSSKNSPLTYTGNDIWGWSLVTSESDGKFLGYVIWETDQTGDGYYSYDVYGINKDSTFEKIYSKYNCNFPGFLTNSCENGFAWEESVSVNSPVKHIYCEDTNEIYDIDEIFYSVGDVNIIISGSNMGLVGKIYNKKAIISGNNWSNQEERLYTLVDLETPNKALSKGYKSMSTNDGKIYLVKTLDDKWGFIDNTGKELAVFDDADNFMGDYAPVVKNGKGYLIDRNMKKVSEEIDASGVLTLADGLYNFYLNDDVMLVTYASSESKSGNTSSSSSSVSTPANSGDNDNPNSGAAMALIPVALVGGAAAVVSKKRRK